MTTRKEFRIVYFVLRYMSRRPAHSVTRLGDFWNFFVTNFITKAAQMFGDFLVSCENHHLLSKIGKATFWATFGKTWATFYFNIWSHCGPPTYLPTFNNIGIVVLSLRLVRKHRKQSAINEFS